MIKGIKGSLGTTLLYWFLFISLVPIAIVTYMSYNIAVSGLYKSAIIDLEHASASKKNFIDNWFEYRKIDISSWAKTQSTLEFMESLVDTYKANPESLIKHIQSYRYIENITGKQYDLVKIHEQYKYIYDILLIDSKGNILFTVEKEYDLGTNLLDGRYSSTKLSDSFRKTIKDKGLHYSDLEYYEPSGIATSFLTAPILDEWGEVVGVLTVQLKVDKLFSVFKERDSVLAYFKHYLLGSDGILRTTIDTGHQALEFIVDKEQFPALYTSHIKEKEALNEKNEASRYTDLLGKRVIGMHQEINVLGVKWSLISEVDEEVVASGAKEMLYSIVMFVIVLMIFIIIISLYVSRRISSPIKELAQASIDFSNGKKDVYIDNDSSGEIGELNYSFNSMIDNIKLKDKNLEEQKYALDEHAIVAITNVQGKITFVNQKFIEISGYTKDELLGSNHRILNSGFYPREFWKNMYDTLQSGETWNAEVRNINKSGEYYWVDTTIIPFMEDAKPKSYIAIRTDITQKKKNEEELIEAKEHAEDTVKAKSEFLASMSHEIRTPMNGVLGMLNLLSNTKLDETQSHRVHLATSSANALLTLINDILDFSKIEAGKLELENINFDFREELGNFAEAIALGAQEKGVEIVLDMKDSANISMIKSDPGRIRQILTNLVGNAVKFTREGTILIKATIDKSDQKNIRLIVSVADSGIGIPEDKIGQLFESFSQVDASTTRKYGGTGLGLAIAKTLCELMNGSIKVESKFGDGSIFTFNIGIEIDTDAPEVVLGESLKSKRVLIVDDNDINQKVLRSQLEDWGIKVYSAFDADKALEICNLEFDKGQNPAFDLVLIDMSMPVVDGIELAKLIRKEDKYETMKLVMMSSVDFKQDAKEFARIGFNAFFPKPVTTTNLFNALNILSDDSGNIANLYKFKEKEESLFSSDTRILLVEDNYTNQVVALGLLESLHLSADVANNGQEAINILSMTKRPYDIILMDCQMPEMDGYEATRTLRDKTFSSVHYDTTVVAMTANAMQGDKEKCLASGMNDYLAKPIDAQKFKGMLEKYILGKETFIAAIDKEETNTILLWDREDALTRLGGSQKILNKVIGIFLDDVEKELEHLFVALKKEDYEGIKLSAHSMKGAAGNVGATKLQLLAKEIEFDAKESVTIDAIQSKFENLKDCLAETVTELSKAQEGSATINSVSISNDDMIDSLKSLLDDVKNGEFIQTEEIALFQSDKVTEDIKRLQKEIDGFESDKAIQSIQKILVSLT